MSEILEETKVTIDGIDYEIGLLSDGAKSQIENLQFCDERILQLQNELAISNTARIGYLRALKSGISKRNLTGE